MKCLLRLHLLPRQIRTLLLAAGIGYSPLFGRLPELHSAPGWEEEPLGESGLPSHVESAAYFQGALYVSGSRRGSPLPPTPLRWTGTQWVTVGGGMDGDVRALAATKDRLYAGGKFEWAGPIRARNVACWDGQNWAPLPCGQTNGLQGEVEALNTAWAGHLVAVGRFRRTNEAKADVVLCWDGQQWTRPGAGVILEAEIHPKALAVTPNGEIFLSLGVWPRNSFYWLFVRWDGARWHRDRSVRQMDALGVTRDGAVYGAGWFSSGSPGSQKYIARWDGRRWQPLPEQVSHPDRQVYAEISGLAEFQGKLIVGGAFRKAGDRECNLIAEWDGQRFSPLGSGLAGAGMSHADGPRGPLYFENGAPQALVAGDQCLYVLGEFTQAGGIGVHGVARWDGTNWSALSKASVSAVSGPIYALASGSNEVYAAGRFTAAGRAVVPGLARWDGLAWQGFPEPVPAGEYRHLAFDGSRLWASAAYPTNGSRSLLCWDVAPFRLAGQPKPWLTGPIAASSGQVYACSGSVWRLDGTNWTALEGFSGTHWLALAVSPKGDLYAARHSWGGFGGARILRWTGAEWSPIAGWLGGALIVRALCPDDEGLLYAGGDDFRAQPAAKWPRLPPGMAKRLDLNQATAENSPRTWPARWDGQRWAPLGDGVAGIVYALATSGKRLFVGGRFKQASGQPAQNIALWDQEQWHALGEGVDGDVLALAVHGDYLYVGGRFTRAGGKPAANFARWRLR